MDLKIPSTKPGYCWAISVYRGNRGIVACAQEGKFKAAENGGFESFSFMLFEDRNVSVTLPAKRLTDKVAREGRAAMVAKLIADEMAVAP